jgi:hypothetical protein
MSNTFVQAKSAGTGAGPNVTGTLTSTPVSGDLLVVACYAEGGTPTISDSQGNTWNTPGGGGGTLQVFWCKSNGVAGAYSYTVTHCIFTVAGEWSLPAGWVLDSSSAVNTGGPCGPDCGRRIGARDSEHC